MNRFASTTTLTLCLTLAGLLTTDAAAQQRRGGDGRALDANPRVGSGGANSLEGQVDYRVRNDMVTGDVAAGRGLQIEQPYRAANEFGDALGSDDLFDFRAQSLPSAPTQLNAVQRPVNLGGTPSVYRSYSSTPTLVNQPFGQRLAAPSGAYVTTDQLVGPDLMVRDAAVVPPPFTPFEVTPGRALEATVSPLLGVRQELDLQALRRGLPAPAPDAEPAGQPSQPLIDPRQDTRLDLPEYRPLLGAPGADDQTPFSPNAPDTQDESQESGPRLSPTMLMGRQLQSRLGSERADRVDPMTAQRLNRLGENLLNQPAAQTADEDSPYGSVLSAVREGTQDRADQPDGGPAPRATIDLGMMDESLAEQAERQRAQALRRAYGTAGEATDQRPDAAAEERATDHQTDTRAPGYADPLSGLLERLNYDLPPLDTLAGDQATPVNQVMKQAEAALAVGQYFDAEQNYRQVVERRPDDPMARVGLVHAQLGAGMIRSAALNLRSLFEQHPEMIAARYQSNLLPAEDRLRWVRGELEQALEAGQSGSEPALLLAYLGYQVNSRQLIRYGLATAEARAPRDPLMPVLRHIWLDQADNSSNSVE